MGILPSERFNYEVWDEVVHSPCMGEVVYLEDGHEDLPPFTPGSGLGNYVVLKCVDNYFTLGSLRKGAFFVKVGDQVRLDQFIGRVGNSAPGSFPHLHMHVTQGGWGADATPVPVVFDTNYYEFRLFPRNDVYVR